MNVCVNTLIAWKRDDSEAEMLERVLWIDPLNVDSVVISLWGKNALPIWKPLADIDSALLTGSAVKVISDPYARLICPDPEYLNKYHQKRDKAWDIIASLVQNEPEIYFREQRGDLVESIIIQHRVTKATVYKYLRRYWRAGKIKNGLLPLFYKCGAPGEEKPAGKNKRGRPTKLAALAGDSDSGGLNVNADIKEKLCLGYKRYYQKQGEAPWQMAYDKTIQNLFNKGFILNGNVLVPSLPPQSELPTLRQFKYWAKKNQNISITLSKRMGERNFLLKNRGITGSSAQMATGPGSIFQIDATVGDVYLVSSFDRSLIIGRPVIYIVIDVFSRLIVGLYVGLEGPNWIGAMMALANTAGDKVSFCKDYGIDINENQWPSHYLCEKILADRAELLSGSSDVLVDSLNITIANTASYRADWKAIVERQFRCLNDIVIHWLPGAVRARIQERGSRDVRLDAKLTLREFTEILIHLILHHNCNHLISWYSYDEFMIEERVTRIPIELWSWGMKNRGGHLRERSADDIKLSLMPRAEAVVTPAGIKLAPDIYYSCASAVQNDWFVRARTHGTWKIPIAYDPRKTDCIYLLHDKGFEVCALLDKNRNLRDHYYEEILDIAELRSLENHQHKQASHYAQANLQAKIDSITEIATQLTDAASTVTISKKGKVSGIRDNRAKEKEQLRSEEGWQPRKKPYESSVLSHHTLQNITPTLIEQSSLKEKKKKGILKLLRNDKAED